MTTGLGLLYIVLGHTCIGLLYYILCIELGHVLILVWAHLCFEEGHNYGVKVKVRIKVRSMGHS